MRDQVVLYESDTILFTFFSFFLCSVFCYSSSSFGTPTVTCSRRSFSSRILCNLCFQDLKFLDSSSLSSTLMLVAILSCSRNPSPPGYRNNKKIKFLGSGNWTHQKMCWTEASTLVCLDFRKSKFYTSKLDLRISRLVLLVFLYFWYTGTLVLLVFWYFWYWWKLGFHFPGVLSTENVLKVPMSSLG